MILVKPIPIDWRPDLPIFAKESFLKAVSNEYGWLGGFAQSGELKCMLPYTIIKKAIFRMVRFRTESLPMSRDFSVSEETYFLNRVVDHFRSTGVDMIIPAANNAIFRIHPDGARVAPYGTYVIDLTRPEETLWANIDRITRQNIKSASRSGVRVRDAAETELDQAYSLIRNTFKRSDLPFMDMRSFRDFISGLGEYGKVLVADYKDTPQSYVVFGYSDHSAYAIYAGNSAFQQPGANKLLYWEAIRLFRNLGVRLYDFFGTRIQPEKGSKQEALGLFKKRFGAELKQGYMWKFPFHVVKYLFYELAVRVRSGGDIVDAEKHKSGIPPPLPKVTG
jgi:hypothetical protein